MWWSSYACLAGHLLRLSLVDALARRFCCVFLDTCVQAVTHRLPLLLHNSSYIYGLMTKNPWQYYLIALVIVLVDQSSKLWVHFNMSMGCAGAIQLIGTWLKLHYTLNPGMAFGIQFGFKYGKLLLTLGRIVATCVIGWYIRQLVREVGTSTLLLWGWALILGGAVGNVIDSTFYAVLLDNAPHDAPMSWFYGQVIDMVYVDIWESKLPAWLPFIGNSYLSLFPIFNIADAAIFLGVVAILWDRRRKQKAHTSYTTSPAASLHAQDQQKLQPVRQQEMLH